MPDSSKEEEDELDDDELLAELELWLDDDSDDEGELPPLELLDAELDSELPPLELLDSELDAELPWLELLEALLELLDALEEELDVLELDALELDVSSDGCERKQCKYPKRCPAVSAAPRISILICWFDVVRMAVAAVYTGVIAFSPSVRVLYAVALVTSPAAPTAVSTWIVTVAAPPLTSGSTTLITPPTRIVPSGTITPRLCTPMAPPCSEKSHSKAMYSIGFHSLRRLAS